MKEALIMNLKLAAILIVLNSLKVNSSSDLFGELFSGSYEHLTEIFNVKLQMLQRNIESKSHH